MGTCPHLVLVATLTLSGPGIDLLLCFEESRTKKSFFFKFIMKMTSNIISELNVDFSEDFFEVLHIFVGPKIKILENRPDFLTFSAKTHIRL